MALTVKQDGRIVVRAPYGIRKGAADAFVTNHREWIASRQREYEKLLREKPSYTEEERRAGIEAAARILSEKCRYFSERMGVGYGRITIREQKTRWGSCSARGNLNFNWKLALMPETIQDYLVVHELAHRREMNHSPAFWAVVESQIPDYKERRRWLKENGGRY